jgi:hypothetical protein
MTTSHFFEKTLLTIGHFEAIIFIVEMTYSQFERKKENKSALACMNGLVQERMIL